MRLKLLPLPYFLGFGLGLFALSLLGATVRNTALAENFSRFHQLLTPEAGYFATAREVRTIVEREIRANPKVHVVIGGSSVLQGAGQHESLVWTRFLQENLGPQFRVINFAQRAGHMADFGNVAAELLLREGRPVLYVVEPHPIPYSRSPFSHFVLDAWNRNYLLPWPPRDKLLAQGKWHGSSKFRAAAWAALLDRNLNFDDLWNFVSYDFANSIWNPLLRHQPFRPRRQLRDPELMPDRYTRPGYSPGWDERRLRRMIYFDDRRWPELLELVHKTMPPQLRAVTVLVTTLPSSYYRNRLEPSERDAFISGAAGYSQQVQDLGFPRRLLSSVDFTDDDYVDALHLSVSGGRKLAAQLAPVIRQTAMDLGYLP